MRRKLSPETIETVQKLRDKGLSLEEIAKQVGISQSTAYALSVLRQKGFNSYTEYQNYLAKEKKNPLTGEYFESFSEYENYRSKERKLKETNQNYSCFIKRRLENFSKNQTWLASQIGVTRAAVSLYTQGKIMPSQKIQDRIISVFGNIGNFE